jgi:putative Mg2+ transporter-C (MgtC) family protein
VSGPIMTILESLGKIALALLVGGLVGLERERRDLPAGIRTHMLVCAGSALFTLNRAAWAVQVDR